jgi:hypothetical protein
MRLTARVARLEDARRGIQATPCRWHGSLVVYPTTLPRRQDGRMILPPCEEPSTCPGATSSQIFLPERRTA